MDFNDEICEEDFQFNDNESEINDIDNISNDSVSILKDFDLNNLVWLDKVNMENDSNSLLDVLEVFNNIDRDQDMDTTFFSGSQCSQNSSLLNISNEDLTFCESQNEIDFNDEIKEKEHKDIINNDSQLTELYTLPDINTHISQSQENIVISKKYMTANDETKKKKLPNLTERQNESTKIVKNIGYISTIPSHNRKRTKNLTISLDCVQETDNNKRNNCDEILSEVKTIKPDNDIDILENNQKSYIILDKDLSKRISQTVSSLDELEYFSTQSSQNSNIKMNKVNDRISDINDKECMSDDTNLSNDLTESQAEIVTFKVLEELSKVRNYIKREKRNTDSDSGYKSCQTRFSYKNVLPRTCINESAQCLLNFLNSCPLVISVMEITEEVSKALGKLIDKLHEEEKYPKFLENILENVENLINNVYNCDDVVILNIEEKIHRIFLLNRSPNIIKFSIEKITNILENVLTELQNIMEIQQTEQTENLCHILHILEILLKRNISYGNFSSRASSQETSQETVLKRSSLTEIWWKKWNLSKSEVLEAQSSEKKCIITKCKDILNKITVEAMECYSLISFSALQCYNILQK